MTNDAMLMTDARMQSMLIGNLRQQQAEQGPWPNL